MRFVIPISLIGVICIAQTGFAFDWVAVHNAAETMPETSAQQIVAQKPDSAEGLYTLGLVYLSQHKDKQAQEVFERMPASIEARWGIAEVLRRQHKRQESARMLDVIIADDPSFMPAYVSRGFLYYLDLRFNDAVGCARVVMRQTQGKSDVRNVVRAYALYAGAKGMIAHYGGPFSKAINGTVVLPMLRKAEKIRPEAPEVLFGIGCFYILAPGFAGGDIDRGIEYLKRTVARDPLFADAYARLAQAYLFKGDRQQYALYLARALAVDPQNELACDVRDKTCIYICARE